MPVRALGVLVFLAAGAVLPAHAEDPPTRRELDDLRDEVRTLKASLLEEDIERYLEGTEASREAQGGTNQGVSFRASLTVVNQNTVGASRSAGGLSGGADDISLVDGDFDLRFEYQATDTLRLFAVLTANNSTGGPEGTNSGFPAGFATAGISATPTLAGVFDGIGVNGTVPTNPGSVTSEELGVQSAFDLGNARVHWEMGELDPRRRFLQNAYADDANTQFIHNEFSDPSAIPWLTTSSGTTSLGLHMWASFGENERFTINWGWFNTPGQWFDNGQFMIQFHARRDLGGREMNFRVMGYIQNFFSTPTESRSSGGGASWDWGMTDRVGFFLRIAAEGGDVNPVELSGSYGFQIRGLVGSRPDDVFGVAIAMIRANRSVLAVVEDTEYVVEVYYRWMAADGRLQITPHLIYVKDPGGGSPPFSRDNLFILGLRIHVPF